MVELSTPKIFELVKEVKTLAMYILIESTLNTKKQSQYFIFLQESMGDVPKLVNDFASQTLLKSDST